MCKLIILIFQIFILHFYIFTRDTKTYLEFFKSLFSFSYKMSHYNLQPFKLLHNPGVISALTNPLYPEVLVQDESLYCLAKTI